MTIVRAAGSVTFPSRFTLVGAMNPCPCGYRGDGRTRCRCRDAEVRSYLARLSGPLLDRIDLQIEVGRVATDDLLAEAPAPDGESARVRSRVIAARERAAHRFGGEAGVFANAQLGPRLVRRHCLVRGAGRALLRAAAERLALTARSLDRVLKVARTIADLDGGSPEIEERHLAEALQYRGLERTWPRPEE